MIERLVEAEANLAHLRTLCRELSNLDGNARSHVASLISDYGGKIYCLSVAIDPAKATHMTHRKEFNDAMQAQIDKIASDLSWIEADYLAAAQKLDTLMTP